MYNYIEQIEQYILTGCTNNNVRTVGVELETILYNKEACRLPVNPGDQYSASDFICELIQNYTSTGIDISTSVEPGGQIEWASRPAETIHELSRELENLDSVLNDICDKQNIERIDYALEPLYSPSDITLIDQKKYHLMHDRFTRSGNHGPWMMRNTASVQVNIDILDKKDAEECSFIADCISPFAAILFSNAPFMNGRTLGHENMRYRIWEDTDPTRCRHLLDHGMQGPSGLLAHFCQYILDVPVIFTTPDPSGEAGEFTGTIKQWLDSVSEDKNLPPEHIKTALHQIFTHVRFKTVLELRSADRPPSGYELAPVCWWMALMEKGKIREMLLEQCMRWQINERNDLNIKAATLDWDQMGPGNRTILYWIEWLCERVYDSLSERSEQMQIESEVKHIEPFINDVLKKGVFTLQTQKEFAKTDMTLKEFIMKNKHHV